MNGGLNTYAYVEGNPNIAIDPFGLNGFIQETAGTPNSLKSLKETIGLFSSWLTGIGNDYNLYGPDSLQTREMMNVPSISGARDKFYNAYCQDTTSNGIDAGSDFGWKGYGQSIDSNWTWFFVGRFSTTVYQQDDNATLTFVLRNKSHFRSFTMMRKKWIPSWERSSDFPTPMGNISQSYYWEEPIDTGRCSCQ